MENGNFKICHIELDRNIDNQSLHSYWIFYAKSSCYVYYKKNTKQKRPSYQTKVQSYAVRDKIPVGINSSI